MATAFSPEQALQKTALFAPLGSEDLQKVSKCAQHRVFRENELIFHRDDPPGPVFVIQTGRVKIGVTSPEGKETLLAYLSPGDCFGEMSALDGLPRSADAIAVEATGTLYFRREDFVTLATNVPRLALELFRQMGRKLRLTDQLVGDLVFFDVQSRVARRLLEMGEQFGVKTEDGLEIPIAMTQQDLANMVGATREMVNRAVSFYRTRGLLKQRGNRFVIVSVRGLEQDV
jgi:CRP/FNR family transcriptional regulator, cyclic AMP receptor protein